jgi:1-acyl-sn-glycerol-3-phosphate acyltransferase
MKYWLGRAYLYLLGWKLQGQKPHEKKYLILAAPHTSNWDVPLMLAMSYVYGVRLSWIGKHSLFRGPWGLLMRGLGGVPVDRRARHHAVQQIVAEFARRDELSLAITPEGTRGRAEYWKSGFYHIAVGANVPIVLGRLDYRTKSGGLYEILHPTGDVKADMGKIRAFYAGASGKYPNDFGPIRLREESAATASAPSPDASD